MQGELTVKDLQERMVPSVDGSGYDPPRVNVPNIQVDEVVSNDSVELAEASNGNSFLRRYTFLMAYVIFCAFWTLK